MHLIIDVLLQNAICFQFSKTSSRLWFKILNFWLIFIFFFGKWRVSGIVPIPLTRTTGSRLLPPPTALGFIFTILQTNWYLLVFRYTRTKCCSRTGTSLHTLFYLQQKCWPVHRKACIVRGFILQNWTFQRGCGL